MQERTHNDKAFSIINCFDEYTRECLAVCVKPQLNKQDVLTDLFCERGVPVHLRSENCSEFTAIHV